VQAFVIKFPIDRDVGKDKASRPQVGAPKNPGDMKLDVPQPDIKVVFQGGFWLALLATAGALGGVVAETSARSRDTARRREPYGEGERPDDDVGDIHPW